MGLNVRYAVMAAKAETTPGTAETLSDSDAFRIVGTPRFSPGVNMIERNIVRDSLSPQADLVGAQSARLEFDVELVGNSSGGTAPEWAELLKGVTLKGETYQTTAYRITPTSTDSDIKTLTLGFYLDGVRYLVYGARGTVSLVLSSEAIPLLRFSFLGAAWSVSDQAILTLTPDTSVPAPFREATFTIGGTSLQTGNLTIDLDVELELIPDITKASGYSVCQHGERRTKGSFNPAMETVATHDFFGNWKGGTTAALNATWGTGTSKVAISAPKCQYTGFSQGDRGSIHGWNVTFKLAEDSGSDELAVVLGTET